MAILRKKKVAQLTSNVKLDHARQAITAAANHAVEAENLAAHEETNSAAMAAHFAAASTEAASRKEYVKGLLVALPTED